MVTDVPRLGNIVGNGRRFHRVMSAQETLAFAGNHRFKDLFLPSSFPAITAVVAPRTNPAAMDFPSAR